MTIKREARMLSAFPKETANILERVAVFKIREKTNVKRGVPRDKHWRSDVCWIVCKQYIGKSKSANWRESSPSSSCGALSCMNMHLRLQLDDVDSIFTQNTRRLRMLWNMHGGVTWLGSGGFFSGDGCRNTWIPYITGGIHLPGPVI